MREPRIDGFLPAGTLLRGTLEFSGTLWIDAEIHGAVRASAAAPSTLIIGPRAKVFGNIEAGQITIYGAVTGRICSLGALIFEHGARVVSEEIVHRGFTIHSGAHVEGTLAPPPQLQQSANSIQPRANVQPLRTEPPREPSTSVAADRQRRAPVFVAAER